MAISFAAVPTQTAYVARVHIRRGGELATGFTTKWYRHFHDADTDARTLLDCQIVEYRQAIGKA